MELDEGQPPYPAERIKHAVSSCCSSVVNEPDQYPQGCVFDPTWLRIWRCHELWCRLQTLLGSHVALAVVQAGSCTSNLTPSLRTSICRGCDPKKTKKKKKESNTLPILCYFQPNKKDRPVTQEGDVYSLLLTKDKLLKYKTHGRMVHYFCVLQVVIEIIWG